MCDVVSSWSSSSSPSVTADGGDPAIAVGRQLCEAYAAAVAAVNPEALVRRRVEIQLPNESPSHLRLRIQTGGDFASAEGRDASYAEVPITGTIGLVAFGKAAAGMARGLLSNRPAEFTDRLRGGVVLVPKPTPQERRAGLGFFSHGPEDVGGLSTTSLDAIKEKIQVFEGPRDNLPDETVLRGSEAAAHLIDSLGPGDLLVAMVTGGGSAMLAWPRLPLADYRATIRLLSNSGFSIAELNAVRRRLDAVKAGGLAVRCLSRGCNLLGLVLSDVVGDPLSVLASGPTVPLSPLDDAEDARRVASIVQALEQRNIVDRLPLSAARLLVKPDIEVGAAASAEVRSISNIIIGNNQTALAAARHQFLRAASSSSCGVRAAVVMTTELSGDVSTVANRIYAWLIVLDRLMLVEGDGDVSDISGLSEGDLDKLKFAADEWRAASESGSIALLAGGEPTVDTTAVMEGSRAAVGVGGRAGHLALLVAERLGRWRGRGRPHFLAAGTDGIDGPTESAGGLVDATTWRHAIAQFGEARCRAALDGFDSHGLLGRVVGEPPALFRPGLTGTNVMDLVLAVLRV